MYIIYGLLSFLEFRSIWRNCEFVKDYLQIKVYIKKFKKNCIQQYFGKLLQVVFFYLSDFSKCLNSFQTKILLYNFSWHHKVLYYKPLLCHNFFLQQSLFRESFPLPIAA